MAEALSFHSKVKLLRPLEPVNPDVVFVAILKTDKLPTDALVQADALWVKCPWKKPLSAVHKAFVKSQPHPEAIILRHDFKVIPLTTPVGSLNTRHDDMVVLEAIPESQLATRTPSLGKGREALRTVTNEVQGQGPFRMKVEGKEEKTTSQPFSSTTSLAPASWPGPCLSRQELELGWYDFVCDQREKLQRSGLGTPRYNLDQAEVTRMDESIKQMWLTLQDAQRMLYINRARRINETVPPFGVDHRGFWSYIHDEIIRLKLSIDTIDDKDLFFSRSLHVWNSLPEIHHTYSQRNQWFLINYPIPGMPLGQPGLAPTPPKREPSAILPQRESLSPVPKDFKSEPDRDLRSTPAFDEPDDLNSTPPMKDEENPENPAEPQRFNVLELFADSTPEQLENGVKKGLKVLATLRKALEPHDTEESAQWLQSIAKVEKQAVQTKTVVGVVGATGAGKSSVINAMMDEERLVPTNCMRACTAVVTEISYNRDETVRYKAEIEFITREEWRKELKTLFQDLFDGNGNVSRECTNEDSEAGIAYAKLKAVYPKLTKEEMVNTTVDKLLAHNNVNCLGQNRKIEDNDSLKFYKQLQSFVDSKEKNGSNSPDRDKTAKKKPREREYWPLIRVVRLYVKAPALSTGAVIVDLPGVHDSNQARAAVAQGYLKQCTGLWIVAPINRAVDDKSAKTLLGESFKRQLKMDGGYSAVTFICSKTDDISLIEAQDSLGLEDELGALWERKDGLEKEKKGLQKQISDLKDTRADFTLTMESADETLEAWEKLKEDAEDGKPVYRPKAKDASSKKRKRPPAKSSERKKTKYADSDDDDFIDDDSESSDMSDDEEPVSADEDERREPLSETEITEKIGQLKETKKDGRRQRLILDDKIKDLRRKVENISKESDLIDSELSARCISGRNDYSRSAIRLDFAAGIKELDQELAEEEDALNFNPEVDIRDYEEVAKSLAVFCVSARGYQKLMGRHKKDKDVPGFKHVDETEIPKLQAHCKKLTEAGREASCRSFLNSLSQLLNSIKLWASSDGTGQNLTQDQKMKEADVLKQRLDKLDSALTKATRGVITKFSDELQDSIFEAFPNAIAAAKNEASGTASHWGAPVNREDRAAGGLYWATYKAVVRRDGVFTNSQGFHNFNQQLTEPMIKQVIGGWEKAFSRRLPTVMNELPGSIGSLVNSFYKQVESRALRNGTSTAALEMLKQQLPVYKETIKDAAMAAHTDITARQKDINREFVPVVTQFMLSVYGECNDERGPGQYMRMKRMMDRHVCQVKDEMFEEAAERVTKLLKTLMGEIEESLLSKLDEIYRSMVQDYNLVVIGREAGNTSQGLPREQRMLRREILEMGDGVEDLFKGVLGFGTANDSDDEDHVDTEVIPDNGDEDSASVVGAETSPDAEMATSTIADEDQSEVTTAAALMAEERSAAPIIGSDVSESDISGGVASPAGGTDHASEDGRATPASEPVPAPPPSGETEDVTLASSVGGSTNEERMGKDDEMKDGGCDSC